MSQHMISVIIAVTLIAIIINLCFTQQIMAAVVLAVPRFHRSHPVPFPVDFPALRSSQTVIPRSHRQAALGTADFPVQVVAAEAGYHTSIEADVQHMSAAIVQRFQAAPVGKVHRRPVSQFVQAVTHPPRIVLFRGQLSQSVIFQPDFP
ncbi:hypothetical protein C5U37_18950 [Escherichia fergusonii]|nr:hypothetical protein C5U37_18950 [Escherichia fergusonii]